MRLTKSKQKGVFMKKIILGITAIALSFCLTACGSASNDAGLTDLSNQLDETSNTIVDMQTISPNSISLSQSLKNDKLHSASQNARQYSLTEQYYKAEILEKTAQIRDKLDSNVKLSKNQSSALKDLVLSLNKNTCLAKNTKGEMMSAEKTIKSLKKSSSKNQERLSAKYNKLRCNSNIRMAYYENILDILDEIENCLNITEDDTQTKVLSLETEDKQDANIEPKTAKKSYFRKNIDTFKPAEDKNVVENEQKDDLRGRNADTYGPSIRNIDTYNPYRYSNIPYGYGAMPYGGYQMPYGRGFMRRYPGGAFGSNYYNRISTPQNPSIPASTENLENIKETEKEEKTESTTVSLMQSIQKQHKLKNKKDDPIVVAY